MKFGRIILALGALVLGTCRSEAGAIQITDLYNTGVDDAHEALTSGASDTHYEISHLSTTTAPIVYHHNAWVANPTAPPDAQWIAPTGSSVANGLYTYTTTFSLSDEADLASVLISGQFTADDKIANVYLNGQALDIGTTGDEVYRQWFGFSITGTSPFVVGENTLAFETMNTHGSVNGLIVQMSGSYNAVPEPASVAMMGLGGVAALAFARRRLRNDA